MTIERLKSASTTSLDDVISRKSVFCLLVCMFLILSAFSTTMGASTRESQRVEPRIPRTSANISSSGASGVQHLAVILVQFKNLNHTRQQVDIEQNLVRLNEYYQNISYGQIAIDWAIRGWLTLVNTSEFYGQDFQGAPPGYENGRLLLIDSVIAAQNAIDFGQYQHVAVVCAGYDQAITNRTNDLWPQFWPGLNVTTRNGAMVDKAFYLSEFDNVGTYAHEFGHSLGLPDLYPPKNSGRLPLVGWLSLMDSGRPAVFLTVPGRH